ncbi:GFA family protein [Reinekea forsetii]|nr:GFA family protein [Reinekea forsetii]
MGIKEVDGVVIQDRHKANCHCGAVKIRFDLPNGLEELRRCDCSLCRRRGAIAASVSLSGIQIIKGKERLKLYQFNTKTAKHYFCDTCGIYTHHQRRSNPNQYGFNVACLEGVNPLKLESIPTNDGVNHPADRQLSKART